MSRCRTIGPSCEPGDRILLIVEDDPHYARMVGEMAHEHGLKVLICA